MIGRILLLILLLLILLIFFVPYGVDAGYEEGRLFLRVKAGPFHLTLWPKRPLTEKQRARKEKKKAKAEAKKKAAQAKKDGEKKKDDGKPKGTDETITVRKKPEWDLDTILALARMALHAIRRFFRSFTVDFLKIHYTVACRDPYETAMQYGQLCAAVEELPALCGNVIRIRRRDIVIGSDFVESSPAVSARIVLTIQLFRIVHMAAAFLAEYVGWKLKNRKEKKASASLERKDDNGRQPDQ